MYNFEQNKSTWSHIEYLSHNVKQKSSLTHGIANLWNNQNPIRELVKVLTAFSYTHTALSLSPY